MNKMGIPGMRIKKTPTNLSGFHIFLYVYIGNAVNRLKKSKRYGIISERYDYGIDYKKI